MPEFHLADPFEDWSILERANEEAKLILDEDPELKREENRLLKKLTGDLAVIWSLER